MHQHKLKSQDCIPSCHQSHIKNSNCVPWTSWIKISCHGQLTVIPTQVSPSMPQYETTQALSSLATMETDLEVCNYSHLEQSSIRLHASTGHQDPTIEVQCAALDCPMEHHRDQYPSFPCPYWITVSRITPAPLIFSPINCKTLTIFDIPLNCQPFSLFRHLRECIYTSELLVYIHQKNQFLSPIH